MLTMLLPTVRSRLRLFLLLASTTPLAEAGTATAAKQPTSNLLIVSKTFFQT